MPKIDHLRTFLGLAVVCLALLACADEPAVAPDATPRASALAASTPVLWLRAHDLDVADHDPVSTWPDASGNGHDAAAPPGAEPTYVADALGCAPAVELSGAQYLTADTAGAALSQIDDATGGITIITVKNIAASGKQTLVGLYGQTADEEPLRYGVWRKAGTDRLGIGFEKNKRAETESYSDDFVVTTVVVDNQADVARLWEDDELLIDAPGLAEPPAYSVIEHLTIGQDWDEGFVPTDFWHGRVAELLIYDYALPDGEREAIVSELLARYDDPGSPCGGVTENVHQALGSIPGKDIPGWTTVDGAGTGARTWVTLQSNGAPLTYTISSPELGVNAGEAWLFEAVVGAAAIGAPGGEKGPRMWVELFDPLAPPVPPTFGDHRLIEVRLIEDGAGNRRIAMYDGAVGNEMVALDLDWATQPRFRIRLKRWFDGTDHYIYLQAEPSTGFDDPAEPNPMNGNSQRVLLSSFAATSGSGTEFGFGNATAGTYPSTFESIHISRASGSDTILPYWPPVPKLPGLTFDDHGVDSPAGQGIDFDVDLTSERYLASDEADFYIHADGMDIAALPLPSTIDPSGVGSHHRDFDGLSDDQQPDGQLPAVTGWVVVRDVSGRSVDNQGAAPSVHIPDRTSPSGGLAFVEADDPGTFESPVAAYSAANEPMEIAVDVLERSLDVDDSTMTINGVTRQLGDLASTTLGSETTRYVWDSTTVSLGLVEGANMVTVSLVDQEGQASTTPIDHAFDLVL